MIRLDRGSWTHCGLLFSVVVVTLAGLLNSGCGGRQETIEVIPPDLTPPGPPVILAPAPNLISNDALPVFHGTAEIGSTVRLYTGVALIGESVADAAGEWWITPPVPLAETVHFISATATDAAGNTSPASSPLRALTVDITPPVVTITPSVTADPTPVLQGTVTDTGSGVDSVSIEIGGTFYTALISSGSWTVPVTTPLPEGTYDVKATAVDKASNSATDATLDELTVVDLAGLKFTEIQYNPNSSDSHWEWIELYNGTSVTLDIAGWVLDDGSGTRLSTANIASGLLAPGERAVLFDAGNLTDVQFEMAWESGINLVPVTQWPTLNNGGDRISLWPNKPSYDADLLDAPANAALTLVYESGSNGWPTDDGAASIYLTDTTLDPNIGSHWALSISGTGNAYTSTDTTGNGDNTGNDVGSPGK